MNMKAHRVDVAPDESRDTYLGGSDIGTAMGLNPWQSPLELYLEKRGEMERPDLADNDAVYWGGVLEDTIATEYARRTGATVHRVNAALQHPELPWLLAHLDRRVVGERKVLECKTAGQWMAAEWGESGTDDFPASYHAQVAGYLAVTGYDRADLAVLIGGRDFRIYHADRDEEWQQIVISACVEFWRRVQAGEPPPPRDENDLAILYPRNTAEAIQAGEELLKDIDLLKSIKSEAGELQAAQKELELRIKDAIGEAEGLTGEDGDLVATWRSQTRRSLDTKAITRDHPKLAAKYHRSTEFRVLRIK